MAEQTQSTGMGYQPQGGLESLAYGLASQPERSNQPATVNIGGHNILDVTKTNPIDRIGASLKDSATSFIQQRQQQRGKQFLSGVHDIMASNMLPEDRIKNLMELKAQHGTDYGLGLDDIIKTTGDQAERDVKRQATGVGSLQAQRQERLIKQNDFNNATKLRSEFNTNKITQDFNTLNRSFKGITNAFLVSTNKDTKSRIASDQALGVMIQKMLDPQSVVRESEYDRTPQGAALINQLTSILPKLQKGGLALADEDRKAIVDMAQQLLDAGGEVYNQHYMRYMDLAGETGIDPNKIFGGLKPYSKQAFDSTLPGTGAATPTYVRTGTLPNGQKVGVKQDGTVEIIDARLY